MDRRGNFLGPPVANVRTFLPVSQFGNKPRLFAVPLYTEGKRYLPLRPDGTFPIEPKPIKGYIPFVKWKVMPDNLHGWLKEYDENGTIYLGWVSVEMEKETGPIWRSFAREDSGSSREHFVAELREGGWTIYAPVVTVLKNGISLIMPEPLLETPSPTAKAASAQSNIIDKRAFEKWKNAPENNRRADSGRFYVSAQDLAEGSPRLQLRAMALEAAIGARDWIEAKSIASGLGGDYLTRYYLAGGDRGGGFGAAFWYQLAVQTQNPKLKAEAMAQYEQKADAAQVASAVAIADHDARVNAARAQEYADRESAKRWLLSGGGEKMLTSAGPSSTDRAKATEAYMQSFDRYLRGQQAWEPPKLTHMGK